MSRITSVELDEEDVGYVETLMKENRIRSLKEFVEKCVKFGRRFTLDKWTPGLFYVGPLRIVMMPQKALTAIIEHAPEDSYEDIGRDFGEITKSFALFQYQIDTAKDSGSGIRIMSETGLGQFVMPNAQSIQVISPAFPSEVTKTYVETVLGLKLSPVKLRLDVQAFNIGD